MAFNFSNPQLVSISCDKISNDIYQLENLISIDTSLKTKGFMVEYYIRPPVQIVIDLKRYNLDLMYMQLGLQLREHKSNKLEVFLVNNGLREDTKVMVARYNCPLEESTLMITNPLYRPHSSLQQVTFNFPKSYTINGRNIRFCNNISKIIIRICSTLNSTVPCLSFLEIYGKPHLSSSSDIVHFLNLFKVEAKPKMVVTNCQGKNNHDLENLAPSEFFDSITHELMSMPYLLPCGKSVDKSTLDRCLSSANDTPIDPFTRKPYTCESKPIPNPELKLRIDHFLISNGQSEIDSLNEFKRKLFQ